MVYQITEGERIILTTNETGNIQESKAFPIIDGKVIIPLWVVTIGERNTRGERTGSVERYSGNDTFQIVIEIFGNEVQTRKTAPLERIEFSGGKTLF